MKWYFVYDENRECLPHIIPEIILEGVTQNLKHRGVIYLVIEDINDAVSFDLPGMIWKDRSEQKIKIDEIEISIPFSDISEILRKVKKIPSRKEIGTVYYKLHGFYRCLCLTEELKEQFISNLEKIVAIAEIIAEQERQEQNQRLQRFIQSKNDNKNLN